MIFSQHFRDSVYRVFLCIFDLKLTANSETKKQQKFLAAELKILYPSSNNINRTFKVEPSSTLTEFNNRSTTTIEPIKKKECHYESTNIQDRQ